jgi:hypothetical protein
MLDTTGLTKSTVFHCIKPALAKNLLFNKPYPRNLPNACQATIHKPSRLPALLLSRSDQPLFAHLIS